MRTLLACIGVAIASIAATVALFFVYAMVDDSAHGRGKSRVSFSEFLIGVESGRVDEIQVDGQVYTFRGGGRGGASREPLGPQADLAARRTRSTRWRRVTARRCG
ncbi:hypothetical protein BH09MYX1_BH09MYX1_46930 [soil metagenome]